MKKILTLILGLTLIIGAYAGWQYWQNQKTKNNNQSTTNQNASDPSEGGKYLVIKEWSIKFEVPQERRGDLYYALYGDAIVIGSKQFEAYDERCGAGQDKAGTQKQGVTGLFRTQAGTPNPVGYPSFKTLADHDYYIAPNQSACVSDSKYFKQLTSLRDAINPAIQLTLQPMTTE